MKMSQKIEAAKISSDVSERFTTCKMYNIALIVRTYISQRSLFFASLLYFAKWILRRVNENKTDGWNRVWSFSGEFYELFSFPFKNKI